MIDPTNLINYPTERILRQSKQKYESLFTNSFHPEDNPTLNKIHFAGNIIIFRL
jgi:hypothetical protein